MQGVDEPGPELQGICLLLYGEALVAAAHHCLHELMGTDLHDHQSNSGKARGRARCWQWKHVHRPGLETPGMHSWHMHSCAHKDMQCT